MWVSVGKLSVVTNLIWGAVIHERQISERGERGGGYGVGGPTPQLDADGEAPGRLPASQKPMGSKHTPDAVEVDAMLAPWKR